LANDDLTELGPEPANGQPLAPETHFSPLQLHNSPHPKAFSQINIIRDRQNGICASKTKTSCVPDSISLYQGMANVLSGPAIFAGSARCAATEDRRVAIACAQEKAIASTRIPLQLKEAQQVKIMSPILGETSMHFSHYQHLKILSQAQTLDYLV
jgi:hypothetical protein